MILKKIDRVIAAPHCITVAIENRWPHCWSVCTDLVTLTHWGRVTHICVFKLPIIGSDNGLSPGRRQAIIWTNAGILLIGPLGTNFSEILIEIIIFSFKKMRLKVSSGIWRPFCLVLNELRDYFGQSDPRELVILILRNERKNLTGERCRIELLWFVMFYWCPKGFHSAIVWYIETNMGLCCNLDFDAIYCKMYVFCSWS